MSLILEPSQSNIELAALALKNGALVGMPTETVYGLAADAEDEMAVKRVYDVKGRPYDHPLIVHIGSIEYLDKWAINIPTYARKLALEFWPGPMTLILERSDIAKNFITGNQNSVGIRIPNHEVSISLLKTFHEIGGKGLAAPSANKFGSVSPTSAFDCQNDIGYLLHASQDMILNGGESQLGIESTIISALESTPIILRKGFITESAIKKTLKEFEFTLDRKYSDIKVPGIFRKHYSPRCKILINERPEPGDSFLALSRIPTPDGCIRLMNPKDTKEFARNLYRCFRKADEMNFSRIVVIPPTGDELSEAIQDRIDRASHGN